MLKQGFHDTEVWTVRSQEVENRPSNLDSQEYIMPV